MARIGVIGCGFTGRPLVSRLLEAGHEVVATTTTEAKLDALRALGAEPRLARLDDPQSLAAALEGASRVVHLAPPDRAAPVPPQVEALVQALPAGLEAFVYGSTTGAFGNHAKDGQWIDESTPSRDLGRWGRIRLDFERGLREAGLPLRVLRIAGIYGPGRTVLDALDRGMALFEGGPATSRIHVEDLARLLAALTEPGAPPMTVGCDDEPAPTLEVARYACALAGRPAPEVLTLEQARAQMSPAGLEMRMNGRRCRSLVRARLIGDLEFPTYREGLAACLGRAPS